MVSLNSKSRSLERQANSLLKRPRSKKAQARHKAKKVKAAYCASQHEFRHLPKPIRKALTDRFKAERDAGSKTDWNDWLTRQLEILDGLQVQRTTAGDRQDRPIDPEGRRPSRRL